MTLDNEGNPSTSRNPTDPPPRRAASEQTAATEGESSVATMTSASTSQSPDDRPKSTPAAAGSSSDDDDRTAPAAVVRAILSALAPAERAAVILALLGWLRSLAKIAAGVRQGLPLAYAVALTDVATRVLLGDPTEVTEADAADIGAPGAHTYAIIAAWWASGPYDVAREAARGHHGEQGFADAIALLLHEQVSDQVSEQEDEPENEPPPATPVRLIRCEMPDGVTRIATDDGRVFVSSAAPPATRATLDALTRDAARALADVDPHNDRDTDVAERVLLAQRAALAVHGADDTHNAVNTLAGLGSALAAVADHEGAHVEGPDDALTFCDRATRASALLTLAARAFDASRQLCVDSGATDVRAVRWPSAA